MSRSRSRCGGTAVSTLRATAGPLYEYGCHEGNYGLVEILRGARVEEKDC